jgi:hypothetical protein
MKAPQAFIISTVLSAVLCGACLLPQAAFCQGNLTPPGLPAPTMKTLAQVEPRTPISTLPYTISTGGSYYLVSNLVGVASQNGILIQADNVTVDLNGFALIGVGGSLHGITVTSAQQQNLAIYNGTVRGWGGNGIDAGNASNAQYERLRLAGNTGDGLVIGSSAITHDCVAASNGGSGLHVTGSDSRIEANNVNSNTVSGIRVDGVSNLVIKNNAAGNAAGDYNISASSSYGQILFSPGPNFITYNPWANFSASCPTGQTRCANGCVDLQTASNNCGACGNTCSNGTVCSAGSCVCQGATTLCSGSCVDLTSDTNNCGACGTVCGAGTTCVGGTCTGGCPSGQTSCSGSCVDLTSDNNNCGSCGSTCPSGTTCVGGSCALVCPSGEVNCNGTCINVSSDNNNCGACSTVCGAGTTCVGGSCTLVCPLGEVNCNGACVNVSSDNNNCGACGNVCGAGITCVGGSCTLVCPSGEVNCNGACVNLLTDKNNCGACGNACLGTKTCSAGVCH